MRIKTVKFIWSFQNFKLAVLFYFIEISILKVLALIQCSCSLLDETFHSHFPNFAGGLSAQVGLWCLFCSLFSFHFPDVLCFYSLQSMLFSLSPCLSSRWQDHQSEMIFVPAVLSVWLRLSVSLEKAHSCKVLENSCSANTGSRRIGDILGHFKFTLTKCNLPRTCNLLWVENNDRTKQNTQTTQNKPLEQSLESKQWSNYFLKRQEQM